MTYTWQQLEAMQRANPDLQLPPAYGARTTPTPAVRQLAQAGKWSEHELQKAVFDMCAELAAMRPEYWLLMAIPNGQYRKGQRPEPGMMPGAFDLFLPVPSGQYHGLWIELKVGTNKPSRAQLEFMRRMQQQGYKCLVLYDNVESVIAAIESYLEVL